jgi:hypothetical protein
LAQEKPFRYLGSALEIAANVPRVVRQLRAEVVATTHAVAEARTIAPYIPHVD